MTAWGTPDEGDLFVFESDNLETPVEIVSSEAHLTGAPSSSHPTVSLDFFPVAGAVYVSVPDPAGGNIKLVSVTRSDGKSLLPENFWISLEREEHQWHAYTNIFDVNTTGSYSITYLTGAINDTKPPVSRVEIEEPRYSQDPTYVNRNNQFRLYESMGPHPMTVEGTQGILFAVWAPNCISWDIDR